MMKPVQLALLAMVMLVGTATAQTRETQLLRKIPKELPNVSVHHMFTNSKHAFQIHGGEEVEVLLTVHNEHTAPINVTYITGSISTQEQPKLYVQNFTASAIKLPVYNGTDRSFSFKFKPAKNIHQRAFSIALTVFYKDLSNDISGKHATTFFNKTVEIVEQPRWVDTEAISMYLTLAAILAGIGYAVFSALEGFPAFKAFFKKTKKSKRTAAAETTTSDKSDYLVGTAHHMSQLKKQKAADAKKST